MFKLSGKSAGAICVLAVLGFLQGLVLKNYLFPAKPDIPPQNVISLALKNTAQALSYRYTIQMSTLIDGKEQAASDIKGERQNQNSIHFKGQMFESEVDFYQIDSTAYSKDQLTGEWMKNKDNQINQQEIFMFELNPLASFTYKELIEANCRGLEKLNGKRVWVYTASPVINNPYMEILWKDFGYKFWLQPRSLLISKALVTATSKNNPADKLTLLVEFKDFNSNIEIRPPF
ncbi:MAG: hypothetical protein WC834_07480 [Eubacteriales bacterium]